MTSNASKKKLKLTMGSHIPFQALEMSFKSDKEFYFYLYHYRLSGWEMFKGYVKLRWGNHMSHV